jgi:DNA repair exonuclease SbcCD ATPase subunit
VLKEPDELGAWIEKLKNKVKSSRQMVTLLQDTKGKAVQYKSITERIYNYNNDLTQLKADCPAAVDNYLIVALDTRIREQHNREHYKSQLNEATIKGRDTRDKLDRLTEIVNDLAAELKDGEDKEQVLSNERALYKTITDTCKLALDSNCTADCPVCGENVSHEKLRLRLETYNEKLREASNKLRDIVALNAQTSKQLRDMQQDLTQKQTLLTVYTKQYKDNKLLLEAVISENL